MTAFIVERHWLAVNLILQNISNIIWKGNRYLVQYIYIFFFFETKIMLTLLFSEWRLTMFL